MARMPTKAGILPIRSESQAQKMRPAPLNRPSTPTSVAAPAAVMPAMLMAELAATEISEMPVITESPRIAVSMYHCAVDSASFCVKSAVRSFPLAPAEPPEPPAPATV